MQFNKLTKAVLLLLPVFIFLMGCGNTKAGSDITDGLIYILKTHGSGWRE